MNKTYRVVAEGAKWWCEEWKPNGWRSRLAWFDYQSDAEEYIAELKAK